MNIKYILAAGFFCFLSGFDAVAQSAFDLYSISQTDLKGTARFMAMGGAFGALGGDMSVINQNPGGLGIYRSSEIGVTFDWNIKNTTVKAGTASSKVKDTNFNFNNIGYVGSFQTGISALPNINWGFSYSKAASFARRYGGVMPDLRNSMTNFVANQSYGWTAEELGAVAGGYNPYQESSAPWMSILAYNSYLINPYGNATDGTYGGLFNKATTGVGEFEVEERGQVDEYSISIGGNACDLVYWGATIGITDLDYSLYSYYGESLRNADVAYRVGENEYVGAGDAAWGLENFFRMSGTGVNFKLGAILKPVNELRIGIAFHTPTFYALKSQYYANTSYAFHSYDPMTTSDIEGDATTDEGYVGETNFDARTPWKFIGSIAGVIGGRGIISFDYERVMYDGMSVSYDRWVDPDVRQNVKQYFQPSNIFRIGGEFKVTPQFSLRLGYSYQTSPMTEDIVNDRVDVVTAGTTLSYSLDDKIQHVTAGLGYRYKAFYLDFAYVYKERQSNFHAFSSEESVPLPPLANVKDQNHEVVFSLGFKF